MWQSPPARQKIFSELSKFPHFYTAGVPHQPAGTTPRPATTPKTTTHDVMVILNQIAIVRRRIRRKSCVAKQVSPTNHQRSYMDTKCQHTPPGSTPSHLTTVGSLRHHQFRRSVRSSQQNPNTELKASRETKKTAGIGVHNTPQHNTRQHQILQCRVRHYAKQRQSESNRREPFQKISQHM